MRCCVYLWVVCCLLGGVSLRAGVPLDPRAVVLTPSLLPETATVDGALDAWAVVPAVPAEAFKRNLANETITGTAGFAPSLRCGMKAGSSDLYFLAIVRDSQLRAEDSENGLAGDCLELYLDFGREARDRATPDWYKVPYHNSYYPREEPPRGLGQIVVRPPTLQGPMQVFKSPNSEKWRVEVACTLVDGGVAYLVRVDTASVLADLQMAQLPAVVGVDVGFLDQDYAPRLQAENWSNDDGLYRLFGDWVDDVVPTHYGRLATHPVDAVVEQPLAPLPLPLSTLFGATPTAAAVRQALGTLPPARMAQLVEWAGMQGLVFDPELVRALMATDAEAIREACLAALAYTDQEPAAIAAGVEAAYRPAASPYVLALANLLSTRLALGPPARFRALLDHPDPTVAFTAAAALAQVGTADDLARLDAACAARCAALAKAPPIPDTGYHQSYMGKAQQPSATRYYFGIAREALAVRVTPATPPAHTPVRQALHRNTDLPRFLPNDGNTVYNARDLLRRWPAAGPRVCWRATVGQGKSAVIEAGGRAFTLALAGTAQFAVCLDPATGHTLWRVPLAGAEIGATEVVATPVADGDRVYFVPARSGQEEGLTVVCLRTRDGQELWRGQGELEHVAACPTPLIVGDLLYCPLYGGNGKLPVLVAVDKRTGAVRWRAPASVGAAGRKCGSGIASPSYQVVDGVPQIILSVYNSPVNEVWGLDARTGALFWRYPANAHYALIPSPTAVGSRVFLCDGLPPFSACLQMSVRGGRITAQQLYHDARNQCNEFHTVAVLDGCVYGFSHAALQCTRLADGKLLWQHPEQDWARGPQLIAADGLLFILGTTHLTLADATAAGYHERGQTAHHLSLGYPQQPTLANGRLYLRGDTEVVCYEVGGRDEGACFDAL